MQSLHADVHGEGLHAALTAVTYAPLYAGDLQQILQHVTDELATEVSREQQHLMLMQSQV